MSGKCPECRGPSRAKGRVLRVLAICGTLQVFSFMAGSFSTAEPAPESVRVSGAWINAPGVATVSLASGEILKISDQGVKVLSESSQVLQNISFAGSAAYSEPNESTPQQTHEAEDRRFSQPVQPKQMQQQMHSVEEHQPMKSSESTRHYEPVEISTQYNQPQTNDSLQEENEMKHRAADPVDPILPALHNDNNTITAPSNINLTQTSNTNNPPSPNSGRRGRNIRNGDNRRTNSNPPDTHTSRGQTRLRNSSRGRNSNDNSREAHGLPEVFTGPTGVPATPDSRETFTQEAARPQTYDQTSGVPRDSPRTQINGGAPTHTQTLPGASQEADQFAQKDEQQFQPKEFIHYSNEEMFKDAPDSSDSGDAYEYTSIKNIERESNPRTEGDATESANQRGLVASQFVGGAAAITDSFAKVGQAFLTTPMSLANSFDHANTAFHMNNAGMQPYNYNTYNQYPYNCGPHDPSCMYQEYYPYY